MSNSSHLQDLLHKLKYIISCSCLFSLEKEFNDCGLSLQTTTKGRTILCKIKNGKTICKEFVRDYIFVGIADEDKELSARVLGCITEFVIAAASDPDKVKKDIPKWQDGTSLYGKIIVVNEDVEAASMLVDD
jgi:hypothetical protein